MSVCLSQLRFFVFPWCGAAAEPEAAVFCMLVLFQGTGLEASAGGSSQPPAEQRTFLGAHPLPLTWGAHMQHVVRRCPVHARVGRGHVFAPCVLASLVPDVICCWSCSVPIQLAGVVCLRCLGFAVRCMSLVHLRRQGPAQQGLSPASSLTVRCGWLECCVLVHS